MDTKYPIEKRKRRKLERDLYRLPEILPEREIDKFINIWVEAYNYKIPTKIIMKSDLDFKEFLTTDIGDLFGKKNKPGRRR